MSLAVDPYLWDWGDLLFRWLHVIAAIVWIGTSFYFVALDNHLRPPEDEREDLTGEVLAPSLLEAPVGLEVCPVLLDLGPQLGHVLAARRVGEDDRRPPGTISIEREDRPHLVEHRLGRRMIHLVDRDHVRDLHDARLQSLDGVARAGHQHQHDRVRDPDHLDLALTRADRLQEDDLLAGGVEHEQRLQRRLGQTAEMAACAHRADEHAGIEEVIGEADAVA